MMSVSLPNQGPKPVAWSKRAMVSSSHPAVTKVMLDVLKDGGNAIDVAALDMADKAPGIPGSMAEEKEVMEPGVEKFTGIVGMSQWVTANTCSRLGSGSKDYELVLPPVSDIDSDYCFPRFSPERPIGYYLAKGVKKFGTWIPEGGYKYNKEPSVPFEELTKR